MNEFRCSMCNREFKRKENMNRHIDKKVCAKKEYECKYCENKFASNISMYRHMRLNCKIKKEQDAEKDEIYNKLLQLEEENNMLKNGEMTNNRKHNDSKITKLERENRKLKRDMREINKKLQTVSNVINNTNNTMNINNGTINNITLVAYGSEDMSKLDKNELLKALRNGFNSTLLLTETVHFNPKYPEFHNIYITNMKDKYAMMYDGANWALTMKEDLIDKIYDDKKNYIEENLEEFVQSLTLSQKRALERWTNTNEDDKKIRDIKERIKLLLYNSKYIPIGTQNMIDDKNCKDNYDIKVLIKEKGQERARKCKEKR